MSSINDVAQVTATVSCEVQPTFRVKQIEGMFGLSACDCTENTFAVELPSGKDWSIGAIVGASGTGKSTIANQAYPSQMYHSRAWPRDKSVIDGFQKSLTVKQITNTLSAVGFASPPAWVRPYRALSNGEQFRCDLARALLSAKSELVAYDEFTSVVDRTVAKVGSRAVAKAIRKKRVPAKQFVAISCHYDILDWLEPDWVLDMSTCQLARRHLQRGDWHIRPPIHLEISRCNREVWRLFAPHHYLIKSLHNAARCYLATWDNRPVCFIATMHAAGLKRTRRGHRCVVLPDFQGVGIASRVLDVVMQNELLSCDRIDVVTSHPAMIWMLSHSQDWRAFSFKRKSQHSIKTLAVTGSRSRYSASFTYQPERDSK